MKGLMKLIIAIAGIIAVGISIYSCNGEVKNSKDENVFDINVDVEPKDLERSGYLRVDSILAFVKRVKDVEINYFFLPETDIVYTKMIYNYKFTRDSAKISNWLGINNCIMISPMIPMSPTLNKFFVMSKRDGLIFVGFLKEDNLIFRVDLPDTEHIKRSSNREIADDGTIRIQHGGTTRIERNDNVSF